MAQLDPDIQHLLRRAGFGAGAADVDTFARMSPNAAIAYLVDYEGRPDDVDARIGRPDHTQVSSRDLFSPDINIDDARQRWLFRMIHTRRPLQEKMALFWHNHFATAYSKLNADSGATQAAKMMAYTPGALARADGADRAVPPERARQLPRPARQGGAGRRDAGLARWPEQHRGASAGELRPRGDGDLHCRRRPLHRGRRLCRGPRLHRLEPARGPRGPATTTPTPTRHSATARTITTPAPRHFRFPIYANGSRTIPERGAAAGMQDGVDLITALATHPETARAAGAQVLELLRQ